MDLPNDEEEIIILIKTTEFEVNVQEVISAVEERLIEKLKAMTMECIFKSISSRDWIKVIFLYWNIDTSKNCQTSINWHHETDRWINIIYNNLKFVKRPISKCTELNDVQKFTHLCSYLQRHALQAIDRLANFI